MKHFPSRLTIALVAGLLSQASLAADPVATVNGVAIPAERADLMLADVEQRARAQGSEAPGGGAELKDAVRNELIRRTVLEQAALKEGIDKQPETIVRLDIIRQSILAGAYMQNWLKNNPVSDDEIKKKYEDLKKEYGKQYEDFKQRVGDKEYRARHVLVKTEAEAKDVIAKLKKGAKFEELAKANSLDPGSKENGGDLGWNNPSGYVPPFAEALSSLGKGKYTTTPVKTEFGYHVIYLEDTRPLQEKIPPQKIPTLDEVKPQLQQSLLQEKAEEHIKALVGKAEVK
ncbi:MAG: peptidylprolyl isomerase [Azoarcus sp.]|jgi:peptidyl-prolyl cis-trans isomerase C|nr:peptidylprolyl isomerase [Azoarcus sp.]